MQVTAAGQQAGWRQMTSDAELFADAIAGGPEAFAPIVDRYQDAVFGIALARLRDFHRAEDVAQQAFVEAFERLGTLRDPSRLGAWLRSIAIHHCIDHLRRRRDVTRIEDNMHPGGEPGPGEELERRELREAVLAAIARLSRAQRETTTLFYINGYSIAEVAGMQEVPVGTVKRRLHDARARLKEEMMTMVEDVLKSEAPREDFAGRVLEVLSLRRPRPPRPCMPWREMVAELRQIGSRGIEGYVKAMDSPHSPIRVTAMSMIRHGVSDETRETVIALLKASLNDPNKRVRRNAVDAILDVEVSDERRRDEFVPLVLERLGDVSNRVRRRAAYALSLNAADVPWPQAAEALLAERDPGTRWFMAGLMRAILQARHRAGETS